MKRKKPHRSTRISPLSFCGKLMSARDVLSWRERGWSKKERDVLMDLQYEWSKKPTSLDLLQFYREIGVPRSTYSRLIQTDEDMRNMNEFVKDAIGERRQNMAFFPKKYDADSNAIQKTLRNYHPDWRETFNEEAALRTKESDKKSPIIAVIEKYAYEELTDKEIEDPGPRSI